MGRKNKQFGQKKNNKLKQSLLHTVRKLFQKNPGMIFSHREICDNLDVRDGVLRTLVFNLLKDLTHQDFLVATAHDRFKLNLDNNHVIEGCKQSLITFNEKNIEVELIAKDESLDLALLRAKVKPKDFLNLSNDPPEKLQKIYVAGYPFGKGLSDDLKFTQGIISAVKGYADNSNQIQIDAAINSGNSGGPIVDEDGNLVAVAVSGLDKSASEGIGFGIKASSVRNFLDVNDIEYSTPGILNFGMNANKLNSLLEKSAVYTFCN